MIKQDREDKRFYHIWADMKTRCNNPKCKKYYLYGGRGIKVCENWNLYINFKNDMWDSYKKHVKEFGEKQTTLDRINGEDGYSLSNCRWATYSEQAKNIRDKTQYIAKHILTGKIFKVDCCSDFCKKWHLSLNRVYDTIAGRQKYHKGWVFWKINDKEK